jgi:hypothetical protein
MIKSMPANKEYRSNFDTIDWGKKDVGAERSRDSSVGGDASLSEVRQGVESASPESGGDVVPAKVADPCQGLHSIYHVVDDGWQCSRCDKPFVSV